MTVNKEKFLYRHFGMILFFINLAAGTLIYIQGSRMGLFALPRPGMDQHTILEAAQKTAEGILPYPGKYLYSPSYTLYLGVLARITGNNAAMMRLLQLVTVSLVPWMIYRCSIYAGTGRKAAALAGIFWIFSGSALLISLDFLRAGPLALCFVMLVYFMVRSFRSSKLRYPALAGVFAGLCMLGRENFIPVIFIPAVFWLIPWSKYKDKYRKTAVYAVFAVLVLLPVISYNFYHVSSIAILPGNGRNVFEFMQGKGSLDTPLSALCGIIRKSPQTLWSMVTPFENTNSLSLYAHREAIMPLKMLCLPVTLLFSLCFSALTCRKRSIFMILALIACYFGTLIFCEIYYRFRIPALPLLCIAGGAGAVQLAELLRRRSLSSVIFLLPVLAALLIWAKHNPESSLHRSEREATVRFFLDRKMYDRAGELLVKYRKCGVESPVGERFLLGLLVRDGRQQEAGYWYLEFSKHLK